MRPVPVASEVGFRSEAEPSERSGDRPTEGRARQERQRSYARSPVGVVPLVRSESRKLAHSGTTPPSTALSRPH